MQSPNPNSAPVYRTTHRLLLALATLFLAYEGVMTLLIATFAGPHLDAYLKPVTKLVLTAIVLLSASQDQLLPMLLAATVNALLALLWWKALPPSYHNWVHFRAEVLPQLAIVTLAGIVFASTRANNRIIGDRYE